MDEAVRKFRERRAERLAKRFGTRMDEDENGRWVTTENNHKVFIDENGEATKGNPYVIEQMNNEDTPESPKSPKSVTLKTKEQYKSFADDINNLDKKGIIARAKADPEFKELIDGISIYTQGGYFGQRAIAKKIVQEGIDSLGEDYFDDTMTAGSWSKDQDEGFVKQLWNGQKLSESKSSIVGGVVSMIEAINNSEPHPEELYRVADHTAFGNAAGTPGRPLYIPPKVGDKIKMDAPISFTKSKDVIRDLQKFKYGDRIYYTLEPGARALDIEKISRFKQRESLTCGEFEVVEVKNQVCQPMFRKKDMDEHNLKRFEGRPTYINPYDGEEYYGRLETDITIRQIGKTEIGKREDSADCYIDCRDHFDRFSAVPEYRFDEEGEEEGRWVTTENKHKVFIDENGEPTKGNPHVIEAMEGGRSVSEREEVLKKGWTTGRLAERTKVYWDFLEELPIGTVLDLNGEEYEKTGDQEFTSREYHDVMDTEDMVDDANFDFEDRIPKIKELGDKECEKHEFPDKIRKYYEDVEEREAIRKTGKTLKVAKENAIELGARIAYRQEYFNAVIDTLSNLPIGSVVKSDDYGMNMTKFADGTYYDIITGRSMGEFEMALEAIEKDAKVEAPDKKKPLPIGEGVKKRNFENAKSDLEKIEFYRSAILTRAEGRDDYESIKKDVNAYCDAAEKKAKERKQAYADDVKQRLPTVHDCSTIEEISERVEVEELFYKTGRINFGEAVTVDTAKNIAASTIDFFDKNPFMKGQCAGVVVRDLTGEDISGYKNTYAYSGWEGFVVLNEAYFKDMDYFNECWKSDVETKFHGDAPSWSIIHHEFAHQIDNHFTRLCKKRGLLDPNYKDAYFSDIVMDEVFNYFADKAYENGEESQSTFDLMYGVSTYSAENHSPGFKEFLAEAYSIYLTSDHPNEICVQVGKVVEKYAKILGEDNNDRKSS